MNVILSQPEHPILTVSRKISAWLCIIVFAGMLNGFSTPAVTAQETLQLPNEIEAVTIGFENACRLGHWQPLTIQFKDGEASPNRYEISCLDGEGTPITYRGTLQSLPNSPNWKQGFFRIGRTYGTLDVRLFSGEEPGLSFKYQLSKESDVDLVESTQSIILVVGSNETLRGDLEKIVETIVPAPLLRFIEKTEQLPVLPAAYQGVESVLIAADNLSQVDRISPPQYDSLLKWAMAGGRVFVSVGQGAEKSLAKDGQLSKFLAGDYLGSIELTGDSKLRAYADTESTLASQKIPLPLAEIANDAGVVLLSEGGKPVITREARGFGTLTFVGLNLQSERFQNWDGRVTFVRNVLLGKLENQSAELKNISGGRVSHYGYEDMVGQLRVPLDQFSNVQLITFTWVAVLIGLYILCIGPGDYFLLRRGFGRMELTWLTFGLMTLGFCGLAWWMSNLAKPNKLQLNQFEVVDMDAVSGEARGSLWANVYSPTTSTHDIELPPDNTIGFEFDSSSLTWQGLPGNGLGGMGSGATTTLTTTGYSIEVDEQKTVMNGFPLRVSSSKPIFGQWTAKNFKKPRSVIRFNYRFDKPEGSFTNPFDSELSNVRLLYENSVFVIDRKIKPDETIDITFEMREKNAKNYFSRRVSKNKASNVAWDPTDTDFGRIANMLMFFDLAGGQSYTGLTHDYQGFLDMSSTPSLNRAVLVGELRGKPVTPMVIDGESMTELYDNAFTVVRIVLPVDRTRKTKNKN